jgi:hypothetical protein
MGFEYLDHPLAYKYVKDQVVVVLKSRCKWLKKNRKKVKGDHIIALKHTRSNWLKFWHKKRMLQRPFEW